MGNTLASWTQQTSSAKFDIEELQSSLLAQLGKTADILVSLHDLRQRVETEMVFKIIAEHNGRLMQNRLTMGILLTDLDPEVHRELPRSLITTLIDPGKSVYNALVTYENDGEFDKLAAVQWQALIVLHNSDLRRLTESQMKTYRVLRRGEV